MQADKASGDLGRSNPDPLFQTEPNPAVAGNLHQTDVPEINTLI
jgi:hypothetical protein